MFQHTGTTHSSIPVQQFCFRVSVSWSPSVFLLLKVIASPEGHQVGVVGRSRIGDAPSAANIGVAQLVGQALEIIGVEPIVIPEDMVMRGTAGSLWGGEDKTVYVLCMYPNCH